MTGIYASWGSAFLAGVVMLALALKAELISFRSTESRCSACGRLFRRGTPCPCARERSFED